MNFKISKTVSCFECRDAVSLKKANMSEEVCDVLTKHECPNILFFCSSCLPSRDEISEISFTPLRNSRPHINGNSNGMTDLESRVSKLYNEVQYLKNSLEKQEQKIKILQENEDRKSTTSNHDVLDSPLQSPLVSSSLQPSGMKNILTILQDIENKEIKLDDEQKRRNTAIVDKFLQSFLIPELKKDEMFASVYLNYYYSGSFYAGLRITEATEFDINIELSIPATITAEVEFFADSRVYGQIKWKEEKECDAVHKFLQKHSKSIGNGYSALLFEKVTSWIQSLVSKLPRESSLFEELGIMKMKDFKSGPARTVQLKMKDGYFDIDLVPVFKFKYQENKYLQDFENARKYEVNKDKEFWYMVPKDSKGENIFPHDNQFSFTVHFPEVEKTVIYNKNCAKRVIRFLKLLRNRLNWKDIASYHMKTIVMWLIDENPDDALWENGQLFLRLKQALYNLKSCLDDRKLPYFLYPGFNLFHHLSDIQAKNWSNQLNGIIAKVEKDPESNLREIFSERTKNGS